MTVTGICDVRFYRGLLGAMGNNWWVHIERSVEAKWQARRDALVTGSTINHCVEGGVPRWFVTMIPVVAEEITETRSRNVLSYRQRFDGESDGHSCMERQ